VTRRQAAFDLVAATAAIELHAWTDSSALLSKPARTVVLVATVLVAGFVLLRRPPTLRQLGLQPESWSKGLRSLSLGTCAAAILLVAVGAWNGTLFAARDLGRWAASVWHLELLQQIMLQAFLAPRIAVLLGKDGVAASLLSAIMFAALHLPNLLLTLFAFIAAFGWREWFRRHPNLPAVWASHFLLGMTLIATQDPTLLRRLRVGAAYVYFRG
jgi:membrane protease YdiL (CAAX protease family)